MGKKSKPRGTFSVSAKTYARLQAFVRDNGTTIAEVMKKILGDLPEPPK